MGTPILIECGRAVFTLSIGFEDASLFFTFACAFPPSSPAPPRVALFLELAFVYYYALEIPSNPRSGFPVLGRSFLDVTQPDWELGYGYSTMVQSPSVSFPFHPSPGMNRKYALLVEGKEAQVPDSRRRTETPHSRRTSPLERPWSKCFPYL
ncbi:hypothetical protein Salat_2289800 [Sesamum alatum]|uniref:Uncharacterized protein n=1 Tax=Sesamum alatum TaxID=300844 RepID=A0AAE1XVE5_9LAMI|nr:hypothetical protein Salat_2289800 [Sesamum alatum]